MITKLARTENLLIKGAITYLCPYYFLKKVYSLHNYQKTVSLSFDIDYEEDVLALPFVISRLKKYQIKASFAVIGMMVEKYPEQHKLIVKEGHEVINHSYSHPFHDKLGVEKHFCDLTSEEVESEVQKCDDVCRKILGVKPTVFRVPHFPNTRIVKEFNFDMLYHILEKIGYRYSSSTIGVKTIDYGEPYFVKGHHIVEIPLSGCPKHPFGVFDTWHSFRAGNASHKNPEEFVKLFKKLINIGDKCYLNFYFDPQDIMNSLGDKWFCEMLAYLVSLRIQKKIDICTYEWLL